MISILLPIYNGYDFAAECINSIKAQTFKNWELLIGINGHEQNSKVYKKLCKFQNEKIKIFQYDFKSKPLTLNELCKIAHPVIALIDVDDLWLPNKLLLQIPYLKKYDIVGSNCIYFGDKKLNKKLQSGKLELKDFIYRNPLINSSIIMKKKYYIGEDNEFSRIGLDDYDVWFRALSKEAKIYNMEEMTVKHRLHNTSFFNTRNNNYVFKLQTKWINYFKDKYGVTIIIPLPDNYYKEHYIKMMLNSIYTQTFQNIQLYIIVKHKNIIKIVEKLTENYDRYKIIKGEMSYDRMIKCGDKPYIAFLEYRDLWRKDKLAYQIINIKEHHGICINGEYYDNKVKKGKMVNDIMKMHKSGMLMKREYFKKYPKSFHNIYFNKENMMQKGS